MVMARNVHTTLECYVRKDGKYLMLRRADSKKIMPGVWMAPGGKKEPLEGLFECARREILEETSLRIKNLRLRAVGTIYLEDIDTELHVYFLTADHESGEVAENPSEGEFSWLEPNEILQLDNLLAELRHVLPHVFSSKEDVLSFKSVYDKGNNMTSFEIEE